MERTRAAAQSAQAAWRATSRDERVALIERMVAATTARAAASAGFDCPGRTVQAVNVARMRATAAAPRAGATRPSGRSPNSRNPTASSSSAARCASPAPPIAEISGVLQARRLLEPRVAQLAGFAATKNDLEEIADVIRQQREAADDGEGEGREGECEGDKAAAR